MKDLWTKFGCLITGWNYNILKTCTEASRKQLKKYSSAILILIIIWALVGYSFAQRYVKAELWVCIMVAIVFVLIIVQIERQIILTVGKNRWLTVFRFVIALIMAVLGSAILDQIIFKDDIEKKMIEIVDRQVKEQLPNRIGIIDADWQHTQQEIDSVEQRNLILYEEISKRPMINIVSTTFTTTPITQEDGTVKNVPDGRTVTTIPVANPKAKEAEINEKHLEELRKKHQELSKQKLDAEKDLRKELGDKTGFLEELGAIVEILGQSNIALVFYIVLFVFLMSLELFVVMSKAGDSKSDYDLVVEHQLEQKKKTLKQLTN